jgi:putative membrane protein
MNRFVKGAVAGAIATVPMTLVMLWVHRQIPRHERKMLPPEQITKDVAERLDAHELVEGPAERKGTSLVNHFAYGTATGALYMAVEDLIDLNPALKGIAWGLAVWGVSYLGWMPAAGIRQTATRRPASENEMMIASHAVWGAILGLLVDSQALGKNGTLTA